MATIQRSNDLQCKILVVISGGPMGMGALFTESSGCNSSFGHIPLPAAKARCLWLPSNSLGCCFCLTYWPMLYLGSELPGTEVSLCHGQNHTGYRQVQELCGSSACSSHRTCFGTHAVMPGHPLSMAADRKPRTVHFWPQGLKGNPTLQQLRDILWHFYINPSLHLSIFSCIECALHDNGFCPHFEHTHFRSLQACY